MGPPSSRCSRMTTRSDGTRAARRRLRSRCARLPDEFPASSSGSASAPRSRPRCVALDPLRRGLQLENPPCRRSAVPQLNQVLVMAFAGSRLSGASWSHSTSGTCRSMRTSGVPSGRPGEAHPPRRPEPVRQSCPSTRRSSNESNRSLLRRVVMEYPHETVNLRAARCSIVHQSRKVRVLQRGDGQADRLSPEVTRAVAKTFRETRSSLSREHPSFGVGLHLSSPFTTWDTVLTRRRPPARRRPWCPRRAPSPCGRDIEPPNPCANACTV